MGWKGALRSANAAANRAERERNRHNNAVGREETRALRQVDQGSDAAMRQAADFEQHLVRAPIQTLALRCTPAGLLAEPFQINTGTIQGAVRLLHQVGPWRPTLLAETAACRVSLLDFIPMPFATLAVFRIDTANERVRLNWMTKSDPRTSPVFLVDETNSQYYYPKETDLVGEVVPQQSRLGVVAFDAFRIPTGTVTLHLSGLKLGDDATTVAFRIPSPSLAQDIHAALSEPRLVHRVGQEIQRITSNQVAMIRQQAAGSLAKRGGGCGCVLALAVVVAVVVLALMA